LNLRLPLPVQQCSYQYASTPPGVQCCRNSLNQNRKVRNPKTNLNSYLIQPNKHVTRVYHKLHCNACHFPINGHSNSHMVSSTNRSQLPGPDPHNSAPGYRNWIRYVFFSAMFRFPQSPTVMGCRACRGAATMNQKYICKTVKRQMLQVPGGGVEGEVQCH